MKAITPAPSSTNSRITIRTRCLSAKTTTLFMSVGLGDTVDEQGALGHHRLTRRQSLGYLDQPVLNAPDLDLAQRDALIGRIGRPQTGRVALIDHRVLRYRRGAAGAVPAGDAEGGEHFGLQRAVGIVDLGPDRQAADGR